MPAKKGRSTHLVAEPSAQFMAPSVVSLLDVNVWVALMDDAHVGSARANAFIDNPTTRIATCPLTENGIIRVLNLPSYAKRGALGITQVRNQLALACSQLNHVFWADELSLRSDAVFDFTQVHGHNQITDVYLLALAVKHGGQLVTFDQSVPLKAVKGAEPRHLLVL